MKVNVYIEKGSHEVMSEKEAINWEKERYFSDICDEFLNNYWCYDEIIKGFLYNDPMAQCPTKEDFEDFMYAKIDSWLAEDFYIKEIEVE